MPDKALISDLTWRSLEMQKAAFPDMPHYTIDEISSLLRPSIRAEKLNIHVLSLAIIADNEEDFRDFIELAQKRGINLHTKDECLEFLFNRVMAYRTEHLVDMWRKARRNGASKIGGNISGRKKEDITKAAIELIRADWPKPSSEFSTEELLERADVSLNTAKKHLGRRPIEQANYVAKMKRKANREARAI